jgi:hypothetical protein
MATLGIGVHLNGTGIPVAWAVVALAIAGPGSAADDHADAIQTTLAIDIALVLTVAVMISIIRRLTQTDSQPDQRRERPSWA